MVTINAKVTHLFEVIFLKRYFFNAWVQRDFVIRDFYLPRLKKYPEMVISMTFQTIKNYTACEVYLFREKFPVKKKKDF